MQVEQMTLHPEIYISPNDSISEGLDMLEDFQLKGLPVVHEGEYLAYITEKDLLDFPDTEALISAIPYQLDPLYVFPGQHIYDALLHLHSFQLDFIPLVNPTNNRYEGLLLGTDINQQVFNLQSIAQEGAILSLNIRAADYSVAQLAHLIENEDCKILSLAVQQIPNEDRLRITLKLNKHHIAAVESSLIRHNFDIEASYHQAESDTDMDYRFENLMKYLQM